MYTKRAALFRDVRFYEIVVGIKRRATKNVLKMHNRKGQSVNYRMNLRGHEIIFNRYFEV